jgi:hypothetical protein
LFLPPNEKIFNLTIESQQGSHRHKSQHHQALCRFLIS